METQRDWHRELAERIESMKEAPILPQPISSAPVAVCKYCQKSVSRPGMVHTRCQSQILNEDGFDDGAREYDPCPEIDQWGVQHE